MTKRRVVVTGMGIVSPVGNTVETAWTNILAGRSGIGPITAFDTEGVHEEDIALPLEAKPTSTIAAIVSGSVYETGGRTVNRTLKRVLWPADALVGVRPLFDDKDGADANSNARFELVRVDAAGKPQPAKGLKITLVREHRDYHLNYDEDGGWDYDFTRRFENLQVKTIDIGATAPAPSPFVSFSPI